MKDAMKELKKLTSFQDKAARGAKPKGYAEPWCVQVSLYIDYEYSCMQLSSISTLAMGV